MVFIWTAIEMIHLKLKYILWTFIYWSYAYASNLFNAHPTNERMNTNMSFQFFFFFCFAIFRNTHAEEREKKPFDILPQPHKCLHDKYDFDICIIVWDPNKRWYKKKQKLPRSIWNESKLKISLNGKAIDRSVLNMMQLAADSESKIGRYVIHTILFKIHILADFFFTFFSYFEVNINQFRFFFFLAGGLHWEIMILWKIKK